MTGRKEYKPKAIRTLRKMVYDMQEHCAHVSASKYFGCKTCPYNVFYADNSTGCYFQHIGGLKPKDWQLNIMGAYVPTKI